MKTYWKFILSALLAVILTLCSYKLYYTYYVDFSLEARSIGSPATIAIIYHSPINPDSWPSMKPTSGQSSVGNKFQLLKFRIPVKKLDTMNVLLGDGTQTVELRQVRFAHQPTDITLKDTWLNNPPIEQLSEQDGTITIKPLTGQPTRLRLIESATTLKGRRSINWPTAILIWCVSSLVCFDLLGHHKKYQLTSEAI